MKELEMTVKSNVSLALQEENKYFNARAEILSTPDGAAVITVLDAIDSKSSSLLTHVSIMIAILGLSLSFLTTPENGLLIERLMYAEFVLYLLVTINSMQTILQTSPTTFASDARDNADSLKLIARRRRRAHNISVKLTTILTVGFLVLIILEQMPWK